MTSFFNLIKKTFKIIYMIFKLIFSIILYTIKGFRFLIILLKSIFNNLSRHFKKLLRFSITFKMTFFYGMIFTVLLFISSIGILMGFRILLINMASQDIERASNSVISLINSNNEYNLDEELNRITDMSEKNIVVFDKNKEPLFIAGEGTQDTSFHNPSNMSFWENVMSTDYITINKEYTLDDNTYYVQTTKNLAAENGYTEILFVFLFVANGLIVLIALTSGSKASRRILSPIEKMTSTVQAININNLDTRLDVQGVQDELKELAQTFNDMFDRIQNSYEKQNQFVSDASHELRTPIAVIQGYINLLDRWGKNDENVLQESIDAIKDESENMKDLIEKLLFLARTDKGLYQLDKEEFLIDELIEEVGRETQLIDSEHEIICNKEEGLLYYGNRKSLKQALRIFVDNSVKFTPKGGKITLSASSSKKHISMEIQDTGIGIPPEDIPHIFDRFYRSDKSRTKVTGGHGLGLSIAKWAIEAHNGNIKVRSKVDLGTKITILLPLSSKNIRPSESSLKA